MNQFAIFYLLTLTVLYVSFAKAGDGKPDKQICKLKEAKYDHNVSMLGVDTYDQGKVYLYTHKLEKKLRIPDRNPCVIVDGSKKPSEFFIIHICNTIIFENKVEIIGTDMGLAQYITIIPDEDTFKFGRRFFRLDNFPDQHKYRVTEIWRDGTKLEDVTTIKAKDAEGTIPCGVFMVVDSDDKPRFLFSTKIFQSSEKHTDNSKVSITLATKPLTFITIQFATYTGADQFYQFVRRFVAI